jgi:ribonucleoside-triphosphate reductase
MQVIKRDNRKVNFNREKIVNAILKAFKEVDGNVTEYATEKANNIATYIENKALENNKAFTVEEIQDLVENGLMSTKRKDVAKAYIKYRDFRTRERNKNSKFGKLIREKLTASNVQNQNANMDEYSFGGRMGEASSELAKQDALDNLVSEKFVNLYKNNILYIHDFNSYSVGMHNCLTIPFDDLLANGFETRQQSIRESTTISSALQLVAVIIQCQSLVQFGGVSASHIDWTLVPYVRKSFYKHYRTGCHYFYDIDEKDFHIDCKPQELSITHDWYKNTFPKAYEYAMNETKKETYQAVEGMLHNLNSLQSRSGNQLPFSSINYGTCTLEEGRLVTKAILENTIKGGGKLHSTYIFPCQIFKVKSGINKEPNTPNYDLYRLALKCTTLRLYPNYANVDWSTNQYENDGSLDAEMSTMGKCKLAHIKPCEPRLVGVRCKILLTVRS